MSDYDFMPEPPPLDDAYFLPDDPYPDDLFQDLALDLDDLPDANPFLLDPLPPAELSARTLGAPGSEADGWGWHDARLIGVERETEVGTRYEIGCLDLYANVHTGDLGGSYLPIAAFADVDVAAAFYQDQQAQVERDGLANYDLPRFAERAAVRLQGTAPDWTSAGGPEYDAYTLLSDLDAATLAGRDDPPDSALDPLVQTAVELGGVVVKPEVGVRAPQLEGGTAFQALSAIGIEAENFDPTKDPPPFYDAATGTAYWIGVFQPDREDREHCVTSILSLGRNPESGEIEAQLAPCVPGDWDKAYSAAEYLIGVTQQGGIDRCFDTAEGMALATNQRELWEGARGIALEPETASDLAAYTRESWEVEL